MKTEMDGRLVCVEHKVGSIATHVTAHREDTDIHHPVYKVEED